MHTFIKIEQQVPPETLPEINEPYYFLVLLNGEASFSVDFTPYTCNGKNLLFLSPYQLLQCNSADLKSLYLLQFHGDYYCIEYHKVEVACNGILFNNIYEKPFVALTEELFTEIKEVFLRIKQLEIANTSYDLSIAKSYLQLVLALSSKEKQLEHQHLAAVASPDQDILHFKALLEAHFLKEKSVSFYAAQYGLTADAFSRKVKKHYGKIPTKLIQDRLSLEAKRLLHLTYKSIKEIAAILGFEDEFYFSRYFKKAVGVAPKIFREKVGISIAAK